MEIAFKANYLRFSNHSSGGHFIHRRERVLAILIEGHLINNFMKIEGNRPKGIGGISVRIFSSFSSGSHFDYCNRIVLTT